MFKVVIRLIVLVMMVGGALMITLGSEDPSQANIVTTLGNFILIGCIALLMVTPLFLGWDIVLGNSVLIPVLCLGLWAVAMIAVFYFGVVATMWSVPTVTVMLFVYLAHGLSSNRYRS